MKEKVIGCNTDMSWWNMDKVKPKLDLQAYIRLAKIAINDQSYIVFMRSYL